MRQDRVAAAVTRRRNNLRGGNKPTTGRYTALLTGRLNHQKIACRGVGFLDPRRGIVDGRYELEGFHVDFQSLALNAVMVTGYPSVCETRSDVTNPFSIGEYRYNRTVDFGLNGKLRYSAHCIERLDHDGAVTLESEFELDGHLELPELSHCEPLVETWSPAAASRVLGQFNISWITTDSKPIKATARTDYRLSTGRELSCEYLRHIELTNPASSHEALTIHQWSTLTVRP